MKTIKDANMNRIILIGNGFDLAHDLPTKYENFIDDFWTNKVKMIEKEGNYTYFRDSYIGTKNNPIYKDEDIIIELHDPNITNAGYTQNIPGAIQSFFDKEKIKIEMQFKNKFLEKIMIAYKNKNWVDIEEEYYVALKNCIAKKEGSDIDKLNQDFERIKSDLKIYLGNINDKLREYRLDFPKDEIMKKIYYDSENIKSILFLNFNYTATHKFYTGRYDAIRYDKFKTENTNNIIKESIRIHGSLKEADNNPIIFGYGDEKDENYKIIENLNDNRFLDNIKSINYLETRNYKELLNFVKSDCYEVFIMGHSCGISDRTLLSTLFEHDNCLLIKVFYHQINETTDNFSDVVRNISRNFTNKASMREKVVNKMDSESLI